VYTNKEYEPDKVNKAYQKLGIIKRNYIHLTLDCFILLYKSLVRLHLEYANSVWNTQYIENHKKIEKVQMRATKLIHGFQGLPYRQRLQKLHLPNLKYRRLRGDMIELYRIITGKYRYDKDACVKIKSVTYQLVAWHSGRTSVSGRRTFPVLLSTCS